MPAAAHSGRGPGWRGLAINGGVCLLIAVVIQVVAGGTWFLGNLTVSFAIGYSIYGCIWLGFRLLSPRVPGLVLVAAGMILGLLLGLTLAGTVLAQQPGYFFGEQLEVLILGVLFGVIATAGFVFVGDIWDVRARLQRAEQEALKRDKSLAESELRVLQAQIEPHFLFNTLANVISLIDSDPARATRLLERLTSLLRTTLARTRGQTVTLADELAMVRDYLEIQALRMEGRLSYEVDWEPAVADWPVPPLLVQPLVENAVLHGIEPRAAGGQVKVSARLGPNGLVIAIEDDGTGLDTSAPGGTGLGNVRARLQALHGDAARLRLTESASGGVRAVLELPLTELPLPELPLPEPAE